MSEAPRTTLSDPQSGAVPGEPHDIRLKRLIIRAGHRGIREMDLILSAWCAARLSTAEPKVLDLFETMLEESDHDLYAWVSGRVAAPKAYASLIADMAEIMEMQPRGADLQNSSRN